MYLYMREKRKKIRIKKEGKFGIAKYAFILKNCLLRMLATWRNWFNIIWGIHLFLRFSFHFILFILYFTICNCWNVLQLSRWPGLSVLRLRLLAQKWTILHMKQTHLYSFFKISLLYVFTDTEKTWKPIQFGVVWLFKSISLYIYIIVIQFDFGYIHH